MARLGRRRALKLWSYAPFQRDIDRGIVLHGCLSVLILGPDLRPLFHHHREGRPPLRDDCGGNQARLQHLRLASAAEALDADVAKQAKYVRTQMWIPVGYFESRIPLEADQETVLLITLYPEFEPLKQRKQQLWGKANGTGT